MVRPRWLPPLWIFFPLLLLATAFWVPVLPMTATLLALIPVLVYWSQPRRRLLAFAVFAIGGAASVVQVSWFWARPAHPLQDLVPRAVAFVYADRLYFEPTARLDELSTAVRAQAERTGAFPVGRTGWVPPRPCCPGARRVRFHSERRDWAVPPWSTLGFDISGYHWFQYRYESDGARVTLEARADRDGNGVFAQFRFEGEREGDRIAIRGPIIVNETE